MKSGWRSYFPAGQDILHVLLTLLLTPAIFFYEVTVVLPRIEAHGFHTIAALFLLHNVAGNAFCGRLTASLSSIKGKQLPSSGDGWHPCGTCECMVPPRAWHCQVCDICILKRDHHCNFFGCCIGYFNHRYFYMFVFHVFISTLYAFAFNVYFMTYYFDWSIMSWISMAKFFFPLAGVVVDATEQSFHVMFFVVTLLAAAFTGFLLVYHGRVIIRGQITPESKKANLGNYDRGWKNNLMAVLGKKWYLVWISPFITSRMPGDGINWNEDFVVKGD